MQKFGPMSKEATLAGQILAPTDRSGKDALRRYPAGRQRTPLAAALWLASDAKIDDISGGDVHRRDLE